MEERNEEQKVALRRYRNNLKLSGQGYIIFSVWTCMKIFMVYTMRKEDMQELMDIVNVNSYDERIQIYIFAAILIMLLLIMLFSVFVHVGIGLSAIKYSRGVSEKRGFLIPAGVFMVINILGIPGYFIDIHSGLDTIIASILVDLTLAYILFDMIYCACRIRKIRQNADEEIK